MQHQRHLHSLAAATILAVASISPALAADAAVSAQPEAVRRGSDGQVLHLAIGPGVSAPSAETSLLASAKCSDSGTKAFRQEVLRLTNNYRATGRNCGSTFYAATKPLSWDSMLKKAANGHSHDMEKNNFFSHTGSDGSSMSDRISDAGYHWGWAGENIAAGYDTVASVMDGWIKSPGHCANIMSSHYKDIGVACVPSTRADYSSYWTMDLAAPL